jgi:hypothetical protein
MDALTYFLELYHHAHGDVIPGAGAILNLLTPEQMRMKPAGHNSIAWIIWHIARGEDWGVNAMLRGEQQVLARDNWNRRLGVRRVDMGAGMTEDEVADLTANVDLGALRSYYDAVNAATLRFVEAFDFDRLDDPLDVKSRLALAPEALGPGSDVVRRIVERQATNRFFLNVMALSDVYLHVSEAWHVFQMVAPERWPRGA